jgi:hypothetical protein
MEAKERPEYPEIALYGTLTSHLARTLKVLGLKRQPRDVTPTLQSYLDARAAEAERDDSDELPEPPEPPPDPPVS